MLARTRLREWMAQDPKKRTCVALGRALKIRGQAVSQWLSGKSRPDPIHRPALAELTGIEETAWEDADERRAAKLAGELAERNPFATGTEG